MVRVIEAEHGAVTTWTTGDVDTVLDVRALSNATEAAAAARVGVRPSTAKRHLADLRDRSASPRSS